MTFLRAALLWSLGLFALLRTPWAEERLVLPALVIAEPGVCEVEAGAFDVDVAVVVVVSVVV